MEAGDAARALLARGADRIGLWRHVVLQALDDYESDLRHLGVEQAGAGMTPEPAPTGDGQVDAALAALVEHVARRDGWAPPPWTRDPSRTTDQWWFVDDLPGLRVCALRESPLSFRKRGVFVGARGLLRA